MVDIDAAFAKSMLVLYADAREGLPSSFPSFNTSVSKHAPKLRTSERQLTYQPGTGVRADVVRLLVLS